MRSLSLLSVLTFLLALAAAWPWPDASDNLPRDGEVTLRVRQDDSESDSSPSSTDSSPSGTITPRPSRSGSEESSTDSSSPSSTRDEDQSDSGDESTSGTRRTTGSGSRSGSRTTKGPTHTSYDPRLPAGGVSMITPNALAQSKYYKIGDWVTFAWNYTSVSAMPTAVDVLASCSANQGTYTIGLNMTVDPTQKVLWDTGEYQKTATLPLLTEKYTLIIYDAASSISATPESGYLAVSDNFQFGMYSPQAYTPLAEWQCATCNGAISAMGRQTVGFVVGMGAVTVLTFTYFANSFGAF